MSRGRQIALDRELSGARHTCLGSVAQIHSGTNDVDECGRTLHGLKGFVGLHSAARPGSCQAIESRMVRQFGQRNLSYLSRFRTDSGHSCPQQSARHHAIFFESHTTS
jgi:hypothetical protein